ncbi:MAG: Arm DNA-binding domain-containing protein [Desulforhopalus sp.]
MSHVLITARVLDSLKPSKKPYFLRDTTLKGFAVKVNTSGSVKFVAEIRHEGRTSRKTLGEYPILALGDARREALTYIADVKTGQLTTRKDAKSLEELLREYTTTGRLKDRTVTDYHEAIQFYLKDWLKKPVSSITKQMVEKRFYLIRDKGIPPGKRNFYHWKEADHGWSQGSYRLLRGV